MQKNQIIGKGTHLKGTVKQALGELTGDLKLQTEGAADKNVGNAIAFKGDLEAKLVQTVKAVIPARKSESEHLLGTKKEIAGTSKEAFGKATGNLSQEIAGKIERIDGKFHHLMGSIKAPKD
jgi:uncharacterized protein YjbJ (UPF0337 family)